MSVSFPIFPMFFHHHRSVLTQAVLAWAPFAVVITLLSGVIFGSMQHVLRSEANDPQVAMAIDAADAMDKEQPPTALISSNIVEIGKSLSPYVMIYDPQGKLVISSGLLSGVTPSIPAGVFDSVKKNGEDRLTWEPAPGVRQALVVRQSKAGFVAVGRSLQEVEIRERNVLLLSAAGWAASLLTSFVLVFLAVRMGKKD